MQRERERRIKRLSTPEPLWQPLKLKGDGETCVAVARKRQMHHKLIPESIQLVQTEK